MWFFLPFARIPARIHPSFAFGYAPRSMDMCNSKTFVLISCIRVGSSGTVLLSLNCLMYANFVELNHTIYIYTVRKRFTFNQLGALLSSWMCASNLIPKRIMTKCTLHLHNKSQAWKKGTERKWARLREKMNYSQRQRERGEGGGGGRESLRETSRQSCDQIVCMPEIMATNNANGNVVENANISKRFNGARVREWVTKGKKNLCTRRQSTNYNRNDERRRGKNPRRKAGRGEADGKENMKCR